MHVFLDSIGMDIVLVLINGGLWHDLKRLTRENEKYHKLQYKLWQVITTYDKTAVVRNAINYLPNNTA
jgi:hypothetical protein